MLLRSFHCRPPTILGPVVCAMVLSCDHSTTISKQPPGASRFTPAEIALVTELADHVDADEAVARLAKRIAESPTQADAFLAPLRKAIGRARWVIAEKSLQTGFQIDQLWADKSSIWVAIHRDGMHSAFRWDRSTNQTAAVLFPSKNAGVRSWHFSPNGKRVLIQRGQRLLLCDAQSLQPIREIPPVPEDQIADSLISFTLDSLLFAHASQSDGKLLWQIRDSTSGELIRSEALEVVGNNRFLAANITRDGLHLLQEEGNLSRIPLNPLEPFSPVESKIDGTVIRALPARCGNFLCLVHQQAESITRMTLAPSKEALLVTVAERESWERLIPWSQKSSFWHAPLHHESLSKPLDSQSLVAACLENTRLISADKDGTITLSKLLPGDSSVYRNEPYSIIPPSSIHVLKQHLERLSIENWEPLLHGHCEKSVSDPILDPVERRMQMAMSGDDFPSIREAFSNGDEETIGKLIQSSAPSGPKAAACLAAVLGSPRSNWILQCLRDFPDIPPTLARIAKTRIAWLEGAQAEAISLWPGQFPDYQTIRETNDWKGWETEDFQVPFELVRQTIQEVLNEFKVAENASQERRDEVYARIVDPANLQNLGRARLIELTLKAAGEFTKHPAEAARSLELARQAKALGASTAPCLRVEALAFAAMGEHESARSRWVNLITYHPVSDHEPKDYTEAAYSAYENLDSEQAMAFLATGSHRFPNNADYALRAGWIALLIGHPESAWRFLLRGEQAGFSDEKQPYSLALFSIAAMQAGAPEEAAAYHAELMRLDPSWGESQTVETLMWPKELQEPLLHLAANSPITPNRSRELVPTNPESSQ